MNKHKTPFFSLFAALAAQWRICYTRHRRNFGRSCLNSGASARRKSAASGGEERMKLLEQVIKFAINANLSQSFAGIGEAQAALFISARAFVLHSRFAIAELSNQPILIALSILILTQFVQRSGGLRLRCDDVRVTSSSVGRRQSRHRIISD